MKKVGFREIRVCGKITFLNIIFNIKICIAQPQNTQGREVKTLKT